MARTKYSRLMLGCVFAVRRCLGGLCSALCVESRSSKCCECRPLTKAPTAWPVSAHPHLIDPQTAVPYPRFLSSLPFLSPSSTLHPITILFYTAKMQLR